MNSEFDLFENRAMRFAIWLLESRARIILDSGQDVVFSDWIKQECAKPVWEIPQKYFNQVFDKYPYHSDFRYDSGASFRSACASTVKLLVSKLDKDIRSRI